MNKLLLFITIICSNIIVFASDLNKNAIEYFEDSDLTRLLIYGGYYTIGIIAFIAFISMFSKKFRTFISSIVLAIFAILLVIFIFESIQDFEWIPETY